MILSSPFLLQKDKVKLKKLKEEQENKTNNPRLIFIKTVRKDPHFQHINYKESVKLPVT